MRNLQNINLDIEDRIRKELANYTDSKRKRVFSKIFGAALGSVPWIGGFLSAMSDFKSEESQVKSNQLYTEWLGEHSEKMMRLSETLIEVIKKLDEFGEEIDERLESEEYLQIVRKSFRAWDNADTIEKRELIRRLLTNSGAKNIVPDDLIRLFLDWLNQYHEVHFSVIKVIYQNPGITRYQIWQELNGKRVREDSMEADLFKLLIRDLSMGSVIRQHRPTDYFGNFIKKPTKRKSTSSKALKSAFDDEEQYQLTELGKQFVHYTMNEVVRKIE